MIDPVVDIVIRGAIASLFAAAAWHKLSDASRFQASLQAYRILPDRTLRPFARLLPVVEGVVAASLLIPMTKSMAAVAGAGLLGVYSAAIGLNLLRGRRHIDCGCFASSTRTPLSATLLGRNFLLVSAALVASLPASPRPLGWVDLFTIASALSALVLLWMATRRLAQTGPALRRAGGSP